MSLTPRDIANDYADRYSRSGPFRTLPDAIEAAILADRAARPAPSVQMHFGMTERQRECLDFLRNWEGSAPPSFNEIQNALGLASKSGVHRLITGLEERGLIRRLPNRARSIVVIGQEG